MSGRPDFMKPRRNEIERQEKFGNLIDVELKPAESGFPKSMLVLFFSVPKVGKSTAAASFPKPLFIDIDNSLSRLSVHRAGNKLIKSWEEVDLIGWQLAQNPTHGFKTVVIDTVNGLYRLCEEEMCNRLGISGIGQDKKVLANKGLGFGEDWTLVRNLFFKTILKFHALGRHQGFHVVLTAHAKPDALESANRTVDIPGQGARELLSKVELICYLKSDVRPDSEGNQRSVRLLSFSSMTGIQECGSRFPEMDGLDDIVIEDGAYGTIRRTWEKRSKSITVPGGLPVSGSDDRSGHDNGEDEDKSSTDRIPPETTNTKPADPVDGVSDPGSETEQLSGDDDSDDEWITEDPNESGGSSSEDGSNTDEGQRFVKEESGRKVDADFRPSTGSSEGSGDDSDEFRSLEVDPLDNQKLVSVQHPLHLEVLYQQIISICNHIGFTKARFIAGITKNFNITEKEFDSWADDYENKNKMSVRAIASAIKLALISSILKSGKTTQEEIDGWLKDFRNHALFEGE